MSNNSYYEYCKSEQERIKTQIEQETNPYHKKHIEEFSEMMDERIQAVVPHMIEDQQEKVMVKVETYMNGKRVKNEKDIVKGIRDMVSKAFKSVGFK